MIGGDFHALFRLHRGFYRYTEEKVESQESTREMPGVLAELESTQGALCNLQVQFDFVFGERK
ncbi:hypothetical protein L917_20256 [Phytophthora nicotianae]|uniref:Uncharacterized protein n=1 Tax=Phytophthora nicotianae TaxID=4792 RepID=W2K3M6_PHYNI|nr:hypothetical protein L917_20256 [Phytophthora nicotianae]